MISIQSCTQDFLLRTFRQRKSINCNAFEQKYFNNMAKCYGSEKNFCQVFKENRSIFMKQATSVMLKKPRWVWITLPLSLCLPFSFHSPPGQDKKPFDICVSDTIASITFAPRQLAIRVALVNNWLDGVKQRNDVVLSSRSDCERSSMQQTRRKRERERKGTGH